MIEVGRILLMLMEADSSFRKLTEADRQKLVDIEKVDKGWKRLIEVVDVVRS